MATFGLVGVDKKEESRMSSLKQVEKAIGRRLVAADVVDKRREEVCSALGIEMDYSWTQVIIEVKKLKRDRDAWMEKALAMHRDRPVNEEQ